MWESLFPQKINHTFNIASLVLQASPLPYHSADHFQYQRGLACKTIASYAVTISHLHLDFKTWRRVLGSVQIIYIIFRSLLTRTRCLVIAAYVTNGSSGCNTVACGHIKCFCSLLARSGHSTSASFLLLPWAVCVTVDHENTLLTDTD